MTFPRPAGFFARRTLAELVVFLDGRGDVPYTIQAFGECYEVAGGEVDLLIAGRDGNLAVKKIAGFFLVVVPVEPGDVAGPDSPVAHAQFFQVLTGRPGYCDLVYDRLSFINGSAKDASRAEPEFSHTSHTGGTGSAAANPQPSGRT